MDLQTLIQKKFGKVRRSRGKHGIDYIVTCPFCHHKNKMYITPEYGMFHCFRCGSSGSSADLIGRTLNVTGKTHTETSLPSDVEAPGVLTELTTLEDNHPAILYIRNRKFNVKELSEVYGVRYCTEGRTFARLFNTTGTLVFPFWMEGKLIGWQARLLYNPDDLTESECEANGLSKDEDGDWVKPPKYWTSPGLPKGRILFNYDWASQSQVAVICEGVFDAIGIGKSAIASLGKGVTDDQVVLMGKHPNWQLIVIMLDPGDASVEMRNLQYRLSHLKRSLIVELQGYKDPGEAPREEIWLQIARTASRVGIDITQYRFQL